MENVYSLYDKKAMVYSSPFISHSDDEAKRILLDMCIYGGDNLVAKHSTDFSVVRIGSYDKHTGLIHAYSNVVFVIDATDVLYTYRESLLNKDVDTELDPTSVCSPS